MDENSSLQRVHLQKRNEKNKGTKGKINNIPQKPPTLKPGVYLKIAHTYAKSYRSHHYDNIWVQFSQKRITSQKRNINREHATLHRSVVRPSINGKPILPPPNPRDLKGRESRSIEFSFVIHKLILDVISILTFAHFRLCLQEGWTSWVDRVDDASRP